MVRYRAGRLEVSWNGLGGKRLRECGFFGLLQSGYIGSYADRTEHLRTPIDLVSKGNESLVFALRGATTSEKAELDGAKRRRA